MFLLLTQCIAVVCLHFFVKYVKIIEKSHFFLVLLFDRSKKRKIQKNLRI